MPSIDWLSYTIKSAQSDVKNVLEMAYRYLPENFRTLIWGDSCRLENLYNCNYEITHGKMGYQESLEFDCGIKVFYNPVKRLKKIKGLIEVFSEFDRYENPDLMGTHFVISGSCLSRLTEKFTPEDAGLFKNILEDCGIEYNISRVDIAYDTDVDFSLFLDKYQKEEYITKTKKISSHLDLNNRGTLYFGSRKSLSMVRIYDKALEQHLENIIWTRIEGEFKQECAKQMFDNYINECCGDYFIGFLRFVEDKKKI